MDVVSFLRELVSIPSPSGKEEAVAAYLLDRMADLGFQTHRDEAGNVIGIVGEARGAPTIVLLGHMDTVPGFIRVREQSGKLYGRGAVDAKGPLAAFVLAAAQARSEIKGMRVIVVGAVGEETTSSGAHHLARTLNPPAGVIIGEPSGWQGITLGYKGVLKVDYRLTRPVVHSAAERSSPAEMAVAFWNRLASYASRLNHGAGSRFTTLDPTLRAISTFEDGFEEGVDMRISVRLPPGSNVKLLQEQMRGWCDSGRISFPYWEPPFQAEKNTPLVHALLQAVREAGGRPRFKLKTGTSDMNVVGPAWEVPVVAYGPGDSTLDHTPDEHIDLAEFRKGIEVLSRALRIWGVLCRSQRRTQD